MRRTLSHAAMAAAALGAISLSFVEDGWTQLGYIAGIRLQSSTPGTPDAGHGNISGTMIAGTFSGAHAGSGAGLTALNASNLASGTVPGARLSGTYANLLSFSNVGNTYFGSGTNLTGVNADLLDGINSTGFLQAVPNPLWLSGSSSPVVRGQYASGFPGSSGVQGIGGNYGVHGRSDFSGGFGVYGVAGTSGNAGVYGLTDSALGTGVYGHNNANSGVAYGIQGKSESPSGTGMYGIASSGTGVNYGVRGWSASPDGYAGFFSGTGPEVVHVENTGPGGGLRVLSPNAVAVQAQTTAGIACLSATSANPSGYAIYAEAPGIGMYARSNNPDGEGVSGFAAANTGFGVGVRGESAGASGIGVFGLAGSTEGTTKGVYGQVWSPSGYGVLAIASASSGSSVGASGTSYGPTGRGVEGVGMSVSGANYGGYFRSNSSEGYAGWFTGVGPDALVVQNTGSGRGIRVATVSDTAMWATAASAFAAVDARNGAQTGLGVFGFATDAAGANFGVAGQSSSPAGFGVFSFGNMGASGAKPFRIDHPLDPENKFLQHFASESPYPQNFYLGNAVTDASGYSWVELPSYFEEINADFKYQLTVIGKEFAQAIVSEEIKGNRFQIRTSAPGVKVSWRVDANRNDLWVRSHPPEDELAKRESDRGKYQHPELYGMPKQMGMTYRPGPVETRKLAAKSR